MGSSQSNDSIAQLLVERLFEATNGNGGGDVEEIHRLLGLLANDATTRKEVVNARDASLKTPLLRACEREMVEFVQLLLEHGDADLTARDSTGRSALHLCTISPVDREDESFEEANHVSIAQMLLEKNQDLVHLADWNDQTVLHRACLFVDFTMVRLLVENGANILAQDCEERLEERNDHVRQTPVTSEPPATKFYLRPPVPMSLGWSEDVFRNTPLHFATCAEIATILMQGPFIGHTNDWKKFKETNQDSYKSHQLFFTRNDDGLIPLEKLQKSLKVAKQNPDNCLDGEITGLEGAITYLTSFQALPLAVPAFADAQNGNKKRFRDSAVRLNPNLNDFQTFLAQRLFFLLLRRLHVQEVVFEILGFLTPIDVLKRSNRSSNNT